MEKTGRVSVSSVCGAPIVRAAVCTALVCAHAAAQSVFVPLGDLGGTPAFSSASGVSSFDAAAGRTDNLVVVGNSQSPMGREGFRWTAVDGMSGLGSLGGSFFFSSAASVDRTGDVVIGDSSTDTGILAFRWTQGQGMLPLGDLPGGPIQSEATAISGDGTTVVGASRSRTGPTGDEAFRWSQATGMVGLGRLMPEDSSIAHDISADGSIIVGSSGVDSESRTALRWTAAGGLQALEQFAGEIGSSEALGITADGATIVGWSVRDGREVAVRWTDAGIEDLGSPPPFEGASLFAQATNEDGSIIVGFAEVGASLTAFFWTHDDGLRPLRAVLVDDFGLDLNGWSLSVALDVTTHGPTGRTAIVGSGVNPRGASEAFLTVIDPSPPCPADLDGDGRLTIFDFLAFQTLFDDMDPRADFDGDGRFTIFDFLFFQTAFDDGCP